MDLCLSPNCIFIQLDKKGDPSEPRSVVFDHHRRVHYTPQNESAREILDLLTRSQGEAISFDVLKQYLLGQYILTDQQAEYELNIFLTQLDECNILGKPRGKLKVSTEIPIAVVSKKPGTEALGHIRGGVTLICCGYVINRYKP